MTGIGGASRPLPEPGTGTASTFCNEADGLAHVTEAYDTQILIGSIRLEENQAPMATEMSLFFFVTLFSKAIAERYLYLIGTNRQFSLSRTICPALGELK